MRLGIALCVLLALTPGAAPAQAVFKCVGKDGSVSYQSEFCDGAKKFWYAPPEPDPTPAQIRARQYAQQRARAESQELAARAGRAPGYAHSEAQGAAIPIGGTACAAARAQRDAWLKSPQGRDAGIDGRRAWHDYVWNACK